MPNPNAPRLTPIPATHATRAISSVASAVAELGALRPRARSRSQEGQGRARR